MLKKGLRLRKKADFDRVFQGGKPLFFGGVACRLAQNGGKAVALGFSFSKKHLPLAVSRHKLRRQLAEAFREAGGAERKGADIVFYTLRRPDELSYAEARAIVEAVLAQIP